MNTMALFISLIIAISCSSAKQDKKIAPKEKTDISTIGGAVDTKQSTEIDFTALEFDKGNAKLSETDQQHLNELAAKISAVGKVVDDIKILTWSDRNVSTDKDSTNTEIILARQRAESIKNYLIKNLPEEEDIDFYNMAERPEGYSTYLKRKGVPVEQALNEEGKKIDPVGHGLVIIEYQTNPKPSTL